jgi:hypothetical protein
MCTLRRLCLMRSTVNLTPSKNAPTSATTVIVVEIMECCPGHEFACDQGDTQSVRHPICEAISPYVLFISFWGLFLGALSGALWMPICCGGSPVLALVE